mgnify:CR=1 FL=1
MQESIFKGIKQKKRKEFQDLAAQHYIKALQAEEIPPQELGNIRYLIAELYRRQGDFQNALTWFDLALTTPELSLELQTMSQEQKTLATQQDDNNCNYSGYLKSS